MGFSLTRLFRRGGPVVPVVRMSGAIGVGMTFRQGLSLSGIEGALERAFAIKAAPAVAILINSPGGSAVQSHLIFKRIRALAEQKGKRVVVGVEDVAASGGYMIALAGDEIVVDQSSIVGSIGVVFAGFGFPKLLEKVGVERRVHTAGESKVILDPFQKEKPEDVARLEALQREVHAAFIDLVKTRRGAALKDDPDLFTGAFWSGGRAVQLGLADEIGDLREALRRRFGEKVVLRTVAAERGFFRRRFGLTGGRDAGALLRGLVAVIEERLLWSRFGL
ncbi:MAG: S49 family peptidase [Bauldia sp.]|nr:S49 family peptidase [Bauldia sp.]